ncbi:MAG: P-loop NTPase [Proteobacteria bacterium]|nr:P-loop NTPase [Pseudomonadota bacterium]
MPKQTIAVGGGKGGVGKSLIAANLAIAMAQAGRRTILVDADLGGANLHTMFGIDRPSILLEHFIAKKVKSLDETILPTNQNNLTIICGGMPILGTANPKHSQKMKLIRHISALDADVIVIDVGAGVGFNVLDLFNAAETKIVVFTPQLTSLHNGYGFLKAAIHRQMQRMLSPDVREYLQSTSPESGSESLAKLLARLYEHNREEALKARAILTSQNMYLLGNMVRTTKEGHVIGALGKMVKDHLQLEASVLGTIRYGDKMQRSVNERRPFMMSAGIESNAETFRNMVATLFSSWKEDVEPRPQPAAVKVSEHPAATAPYKRKHTRFPVRRLRAVLMVNGEETVGDLRNIAYGGVLVEFGQAAPKPANGRLTIGPNSDDGSVEIMVEERHRDPTGKQIGFSFRNIDERTRREVTNLVASAAAATAVRRTPTSDIAKPPY